MSLEEYKKAVSNGLWKKAKTFDGFKNNSESKKAKDTANNSTAGSTGDVEADPRYIEFLKDIKKITIRAKTKVTAENFLP